MTMRLAPDAITIQHGGSVVHLRPSLRAAYRLDHKHRTIGYIIHGIQQLDLSVIADVIAETSGDEAAARRLLMTKVDQHGARDLQHLVEPLTTLVLVSYGIDLEATAEKQARQPGKPVDWRHALEEMFTIATGFLGWPPETAWAATPAEIVAAHRGHVAKLHAIYGGGEDKQASSYDPQEEVSDREVRNGIARLKAEARRGKP